MKLTCGCVTKGGTGIVEIHCDFHRIKVDPEPKGVEWEFTGEEGINFCFKKERQLLVVPKRELIKNLDIFLKEKREKIVEKFEGMKKDGSDETKDRIEKNGDGYLYERVIGYNIALTEAQEIIRNQE